MEIKATKKELLELLKAQTETIEYLLERFEGAEYDKSFIEEREKTAQKMDELGIYEVMLEI